MTDEQDRAWEENYSLAQRQIKQGKLDEALALARTLGEPDLARKVGAAYERDNDFTNAIAAYDVVAEGTDVYAEDFNPLNKVAGKLVNRAKTLVADNPATAGTDLNTAAGIYQRSDYFDGQRKVARILADSPGIENGLEQALNLAMHTDALAGSGARELLRHIGDVALTREDVQRAARAYVAAESTSGLRNVQNAWTTALGDYGATIVGYENTIDQFYKEKLEE